MDLSITYSTPSCLRDILVDNPKCLDASRCVLNFNIFYCSGQNIPLWEDGLIFCYFHKNSLTKCKNGL